MFTDWIRFLEGSKVPRFSWRRLKAWNQTEAVFMVQRAVQIKDPLLSSLLFLLTATNPSEGCSRKAGRVGCCCTNDTESGLSLTSSKTGPPPDVGAGASPEVKAHRVCRALEPTGIGPPHPPLCPRFLPEGFGLPGWSRDPEYTGRHEEALR